MRMEMAKRRRQPPYGRDAYRRIAEDLPGRKNVILDEIDNPGEVISGEYVNAGGKIAALRLLDYDILGSHKNRGYITLTEHDAGRRWQEYWHRTGIGALQAMDPTKEPVDGHGATRADITDGRMDAYREIEKARAELGEEGNMLIRSTLADGLTLKQVAYMQGDMREARLKYLGGRLRECLQTLAKLWGMA